MAAMTDRYLRPSTADDVVNAAVRWLTRIGISLAGSRVLAVQGRKSGEWRTVPVNLLTIDGERYLVSPRGHTQWVRNLRAAGGGELRVGRRVEEFTAVEIPLAERPAVVREYLRRWAWEVGRFFDGIDTGSSDEDLLRVAPGFPVFRLAGK